MRKLIMLFLFLGCLRLSFDLFYPPINIDKTEKEGTNYFSHG